MTTDTNELKGGGGVNTSESSKLELETKAWVKNLALTKGVVAVVLSEEIKGSKEEETVDIFEKYQNENKKEETKIILFYFEKSF